MLARLADYGAGYASKIVGGAANKEELDVIVNICSACGYPKVGPGSFCAACRPVGVLAGNFPVRPMELTGALMAADLASASDWAPRAG